MHNPYAGLVENQERSGHHQLGKDIGAGGDRRGDDEDGYDGALADASQELGRNQAEPAQKVGKDGQFENNSEPEQHPRGEAEKFAGGGMGVI